MTIAFVAASSRSGASGADPTVPKPSGTVDNNLLVAMCSDGSTGNTITPPSDTNPWLTAESATNGALRLYYKFANSEPADYTFAVPGITGSAITIVAFSGNFDTAANPFDGIGALWQSGQTGNIVIPSISPTTTRYAFAIVHKLANAAGQTFTPPGTTSEDFDASSTAANAGNAGGHETVSSGATGTRTWDPSSATASPHSGYWFALKENATPSSAFLGLI